MLTKTIVGLIVLLILTPPPCSLTQTKAPAHQQKCGKESHPSVVVLGEALEPQEAQQQRPGATAPLDTRPSMYHWGTALVDVEEVDACLYLLTMSINNWRWPTRISIDAMSSGVMKSNVSI